MYWMLLIHFGANLLHVNYTTVPGNSLQLNLYALFNTQSSRQLLLPLPSKICISLSLHLVCALKSRIQSSLVGPSVLFPLSAVLIIHPCNYTANQHQNGDMGTNLNKEVKNTQIFRSETFYFKSLAHKCQRKALNFGFMKRILMPSCGQLRKTSIFPFIRAAIVNNLKTKKRTAYKNIKNASSLTQIV